MSTSKTLQVRIKDKHSKVLVKVAREVNQVWNPLNAVSAQAARPFKNFCFNWRVSNPKSGKYSLGWRPFKGGHAQYNVQSSVNSLCRA